MGQNIFHNNSSIPGCFIDVLVCFAPADEQCISAFCFTDHLPIGNESFKTGVNHEW